MIVTATAYDRKVKVEIHDDELTSNIIKEHKAYSNADLFLMKQSKIGKDDIFIDMGLILGGIQSMVPKNSLRYIHSNHIIRM